MPINGFKRVPRFLNRLVFEYSLRHDDKERGRMIFGFDGDDIPTSEQVDACRDVFFTLQSHLFLSGLEESLAIKEPVLRDKGISLISKDIFSYTTEGGEEELKWIVPVSLKYFTADDTYEGGV